MREFSTTSDDLRTSSTRSTVLSCDVTYDSSEGDPNLIEERNGLFVLHITLCVLSVAGSGVNITVLTRPVMRTASINILLLSVELSNVVLSIHYLPICVMKYAFRHEYYLKKDWERVQAYLNVVLQSAVCLTVWLSAAVAIWRFIAVARPLDAGRLLTKRRALVVAVTLALVVTGSVSTLYFVLKVNGDSVTVCSDGETSKVATTIHLYSISAVNMGHFARAGLTTFFVFFAVPTLVSLTATAGLLWRVAVSVRRRTLFMVHPGVRIADSRVRMSVVLTVMVLAFSLSNFTPYLTTILERLQNKPRIGHPWDYIFDEAVLGLAVNCVSFFGFYFMGTRFRETFHSLVTCSGPKKAPSMDNISVANIMVK